MRKGLLLVGVLITVFALAGCKAGGITVQDNIYDSLGGQVVKVDDSFTYLGSFDPDVMTREDHGRAKVNNVVVTRGDVFVKSTDGVATEIVVLQRLSLRHNNYSWSPSSGEPVDFQGVSFKEVFSEVRAGEDMTTDCYIKMINDNGYTFTNEEYFNRTVMRSSTSRVKVFVSYALAPAAFLSLLRKSASLRSISV